MKTPTRRDSPIDAQNVAHPPATRPLRRPGGRPLMALLIAGHPEESDDYGSKLKLDGYSIVPATGLESGLELAAAVRPDLIFVCMGPWAVVPLVLLVLRSDRATRGVPLVLVTDQTRAQVSAEVGGLLPTENVVPRSSAVHAARQERALTGRPAGCGRRPGWEQWLRPGGR